MKKHIYFLAVFFITSFIFASQAHATVGGPTYLYDFKYDSSKSLLYFIERSESGKGCPPELKQMSMNTFAITTVIDCDTGFTVSDNELRTEIESITANAKPISQINLENNNIKVEITPLHAETLEDGWLIRQNFSAKVYQGTNLLKTFNLTGCNVKQPFVIGGFAVPGLTKKMVLLVSTKSDCFEGGYTGETIYGIEGLTLTDRTTISSYKGAQDLTPSEATLVVYPGQKTPPTPIISPTISTSASPAPTLNNPLRDINQTDSNREIRTAMIAAAFLILGVALGYYTRNK